MVERLILRENLISERGIKSFMLPVNVKRSSLQNLIEIDLRENQIKTFECKWFDGLTNLKTLFMDRIKQVYPALPKDFDKNWRSDFRFIFLDENPCTYVVLYP